MPCQIKLSNKNNVLCKERQVSVSFLPVATSQDIDNGNLKGNRF